MNTVNSVFSEQILADKLSKLNGTQQCIETLSHWCIFHQSKAEVVVTTWIKQFQISQLSQKIPLLYLANDILQNSKRKGNEFVTEFWKVLPEAIKAVAESGDERGKSVITRLVNIWDERKVFGSRTHNLKDVMLGGELPPPLELGKKRPRSVKIMKRDSRSIKTKLSIGGPAEKIVSAIHLVISDHSSEDAEMSKCKSAVSQVSKMEQDIDSACRHAKDPRRKTLAGKLEEEENVLKQCLEKLKAFEANRTVLVTQLRETLQEQESELENVHTLIELAQAQSKAVTDMRKHLADENYITPLKAPSDNVAANGGNVSKTLAAEVVDKLTASSSSQMIMSSVLSTFAAEAAKNAGLSTRADNKQIPASDPTFHMPPAPTPSTNPYQTVLVPPQTLQGQNQGAQSSYQLLPNVANQNYQHPPSGGMQNPYGFPSLPPPPMGPPPLMPPLQQHLQMTQQQPMMQLPQQPMMSLPQQPQAPPGFHPLQPPGMGYYSHPQSH
ncbi:hypothetical protein V2J09_021693 [Rumex salicifolius]